MRLAKRTIFDVLFAFKQSIMPGKQPTVFIDDIKTTKRIREHFSNQADIISEDDLKNVITNFQTITDGTLKTEPDEA